MSFRAKTLGAARGAGSAQPCRPSLPYRLLNAVAVWSRCGLAATRAPGAADRVVNPPNVVTDYDDVL
jgi:hypothetical protein